MPFFGQICMTTANFTPDLRPLWFYVSVTGVVVYWMLYHVYAQVAAR